MLAMLYSLAVMEHTTHAIIDQMIVSGNIDGFLLFLVGAMYSPDGGFFLDIPRMLASLEGPSDLLTMAQELNSQVLQPYVPRISNIISRTFALVRDSASLFLALDEYLFPRPH